MFDSDTQGFYKSEQQESSIMTRSFNPHALQRSAPLLHVGAVYHHEFQSTRPMRGATTLDDLRGSGSLVSIHAPHAGRDSSNLLRGQGIRVSIHAPHAGRDRRERYVRSKRPVSIHAPHAGRDLLLSPISARPTRFNPRAPCGARLMVFCRQIVDKEFQSTRPMRGATRSSRVRACKRGVSIHAPHAGRDRSSPSCQGCSGSFNPRAPCGARRVSDRRASTTACFNPRAPCGARPSRRCLA